ncbi:MAG: outer membrane lipoprotein-sorting protein [Ketobacteraceae bacterium]|nr:outer membrane lipoprotein-sorting protein [Ketobacteraceae bacterium]
MKKIAMTCGAAIGALVMTMPAVAETPEEKGRAIFEEVERRNEGFVDSKVSMLMVLKDKSGNTSEREMRVMTLEGENDEDKTIMVFDTPRDQKGTALLTYSHKNKDDDQWLYLPALKRVKKIASKNRSGPFMGSEFSFEDLAGQDVDEYDYKFLREEPCGDSQCFVVEGYPHDEYSGYTKIVSWIDKEHYRSYKVEFYDRKKSHLKTLIPTGYKLYEGKFWNPDLMVMENHQTGKSTELVRKETEYKTGLDERDFTKNSLKRIR